eukprot:CAMPEP_0171111426 /NCGR_PEP_ID=MMETSP0766_2-20121228/74985_1 /TAXON_ID=439317 /ORGANISM="Gambierdiscus australes, Strain CAWD 149" /LENGTH=66 /DNA_ID=CAMNT_0011573403 /DNA_START=23 /DNA_END=220 /DNA_ORIENTATION=+
MVECRSACALRIVVPPPAPVSAQDRAARCRTGGCSQAKVRGAFDAEGISSSRPWFQHCPFLECQVG